MTYEFNKITDRHNTNAVKLDLAVARGKPADVLPLWVADMDFPTAPEILQALHEKINHGIFGYSVPNERFYEAVKNWQKSEHNYDVERRWIVTTPGVVFAITSAIRAFTKENEAVIIQTPVYYPFKNMIEANNRKLVTSSLFEKDGKWHIDFEDFEKKIIENNIKLFILCSPHNPVGRVWTREELLRLGDICVRHGVVVVSDEIHQDFVFKGSHVVFASIKKEFEDISITCTSPSKTFNLASMMMANNFIPNRELRHKFKKQLDAAGTSQLGVMGLVACEAAYSHGEEWYRHVVDYISDNIEFVKNYVDNNLTGVKMIDIEGTYLVWLDFRGTGLAVEEIERRVIHEAKLWLDSGKIFGDSGRGFERINVACPRSVLKEALDRLKKAFQ